MNVKNLRLVVFVLITSDLCFDLISAGGLTRGTDGQSIDASDAAGEEDHCAADANKTAERGTTTEPDLPGETVPGKTPSRLPRGLGQRSCERSETHTQTKQPIEYQRKIFSGPDYVHSLALFRFLPNRNASSAVKRSGWSVSYTNS